jgi:hypothetical protein
MYFNNMQYTREQKIKIYESLPPELKEAIISVETSEKIQRISEKYSLMLDEMSELADEINLFMLGLTKQADFVGSIAKRLGINEDVAEKISIDVNTEILDAIRDSLRKIQEGEVYVPQAPTNLPTGTISAIEQAGNFTVENRPSSESDLYNNSNINRQAVLNKIEEDHIPLVDHLLTTPISNPQKVEVKKPYTVDPYREQM